MIGSLLAAVAVSAAVATLAACAHAPNTPMVTVGDAEFVVEVLRSPQDKGRGLSGSPSLEPGTGALFVYAPEQAPRVLDEGDAVRSRLRLDRRRLHGTRRDRARPPPRSWNARYEPAGILGARVRRLQSGDQRRGGGERGH